MYLPVPDPTIPLSAEIWIRVWNSWSSAILWRGSGVRYSSTGSNIMLYTTKAGGREHSVHVYTRALRTSWHFDMDSIFQARQFLDSFEGDSELQNFLTSLSETAMFAEVVRAEAKANSVRGKAPSHLPWETQDYRGRTRGLTCTQGWQGTPMTVKAGTRLFTYMYLNQLSKPGKPLFSSVNLRVENPQS